MLDKRGSPVQSNDWTGVDWFGPVYSDAEPIGQDGIELNSIGSTYFKSPHISGPDQSSPGKPLVWIGLYWIGLGWAAAICLHIISHQTRPNQSSPLV
eukprot:1842113-Lingulodinium_polyedra.AAC.1